MQDERLRYYHYHGTITNRGNLCNKFVDSKNKTAVKSVQLRLDETMMKMAKDVKSYELKMIGKQPFVL